MKRELLLLPRAESDIDAHFIYLVENAGVETALRFDDAAIVSFELLCEMPFIGAEREYLNPLLNGIRMWFVKGFENYLIFYRILDDSIQIVRVLYSSQNTESIMLFEM